MYTVPPYQTKPTYLGPTNMSMSVSQDSGNKIIISGKANIKNEKKFSPVFGP